MTNFINFASGSNIVMCKVCKHFFRDKPRFDEHFKKVHGE